MLDTTTTTTNEQGYGAHIDQYPTPYMTAAAAIGLTQVRGAAMAAMAAMVVTGCDWL